MIAISLPTGDGFGWGVCGDSLRDQFRSFKERKLETNDGTPLVFPEPMIHAIQGTNLLPLSFTEWSSSRNVGLCFIEESELVKRFAPNAKRYFDHICAGSSWCADSLRAAGIENVSVAIQGVDSDYFTPDFRTLPPDRFTIFSGGKAEWRKGTDIAMKVIGIMMQRHRDVYAIAAWHNPWPHSQATLSWGNGMAGAIDAAGIDISRLFGPIDKPMTHAETLPMYLQCDLGIFPNRVEGGTNMVMCEFMACGKPVVSIKRHGHSDVVREDSQFTTQEAEERVSARKMQDGSILPVARYWEPNLEAMLADVEYAYERRDLLAADGMENREAMKRFTWAACAQSLLDACEG